MATEVDIGLAFARNELRVHQAKWGPIPRGNIGIITGDVLARIDAREQAQIVDGPYRREGFFKYDANTERERWEAARAIIRRSEPGPHEDANYLALVAREAASVESFIRHGDGGPQAVEVLDHIVLGTTGAPTPEGFTRGVEPDGVIIGISAGMMAMLYEISKAVVLSWKPQPAPAGRDVAFSGLFEDTLAVLDADPYPVQLLHETLATWFYEGFPRARISRKPATHYEPPLQILIKGAERFIVAHEYGHAFMDVLGLLGPDGSRVRQETPAYLPLRELRCDHFATVAVAESAERLDHMPQNMAFQGAVLAMKAFQLFDRGRGIAMTGKPFADTDSQTHPAFTARLQQLINWYGANHPAPGAVERDLGAMKVVHETAEELWRRAEPLFVEDFKKGRPMADIWSPAAS